MAGKDAVEHASSQNKLGTLRLFHEHTNDVILIPAPSNDREDPLNWTQGYKYYVAGLSSWAILLATFGSAGPAILLPEMAMTYFGPPGPTFPAAIAKAAYFITVCALMMGLGNVVWMPLMLKLGRRWVYILAYLLYAGTSAWCACAQTYGSMLAARVFLGCAAGAAEILGPLTIADIFFVHERGKMMVIYSSTLSAGTTVGALIAGAVSIHETWQTFFWISCALTAGTAVLMVFTLPETMYDRSRIVGTAPTVDDHEQKVTAKHDDGESQSVYQTAIGLGHDRVRSRPSFSKVLKTYPVKTYTDEPVWKLVLRPMALIILPSTLWASLVMAVTIGFLVAISSNVSVAFSSMYGFSTWQIGLTFLSGLIGSAAAVWFGGSLSDMIADRLTRRNGGVREPEMRLPAMAVSLVTGPLSLILYGVGVSHQLHWICAVMGIGLVNFTVVQAANISLVYMIDCYRPIAGEVTMAQYTFKSLFGFLLSFYTNPWIEQDGYVLAFGEMAAISGIVFLLSGVFYFYGKALRTKSWQWPIMKALVHWGGDREVGE